MEFTFMSVFFILMSIIMIIYLLYSFKKVNIYFEIGFILIYILIILISVFPSLLNLIESITSIHSSINFIIYSSIFFIFFLLSYLYKEKENHRVEITKIIQEIALKESNNFQKKSDVLIVLPAYNESKVIGNLINDLKKEVNYDILVVDDGSKDNTFDILKKIKGIKVIKHIFNRGAGAATYTGIKFARNKGYDYVILMDSDGQHSPKDIKKLMKYSSKYDIIIGSRMISNNLKNMPIQRRIANLVGSLLTWFFFRKFVWDSQSGFKILNKKAIKRIEINFDRYEFCSEIIGEIYSKNLSVKEVPIEVIYSTHSKSKGQSISNGFKMIIKFIVK